MGGFTHNPTFLAVREFKMAGSAELVDLAEVVKGARMWHMEAPDWSRANQ